MSFVESPQSAGSQSLPAGQDWTGLIVSAALWLWVVGLTWLVQSIGWLADQFALLLGSAQPAWLWPSLSLLQTLLVLLPTLPLAWRWPGRRYRAVFQLWAAAALFTFLFLPVRFVQPPAIQTANLFQITAGLLATAALILRRRAKGLEASISSGLSLQYSLLVASSAAFIVLPWLAWGALGSFLDTMLNAAAGLVLGLTSALLLQDFLLDTVDETRTGPIPAFVLTGLAGGAAILLLASAFGYAGAQLVLMLVLPALAWIIGAIGPLARNPGRRVGWFPPFLLIGIVAAVPLMFIDPDELMLLLNITTRDVLYWTALAALASAAITLVLTLLLILVSRQLPGIMRPRPMATIAVVSWALATLVYATAGQPGFFGEQLFVVFKDQANLAGAASITDYNARRQFVYAQLVDQAERSQVQIRDSLDRLHVRYKPYYLVNAMAVDGGPLLRRWLASRPEVDRVLDNPILRPLPSASPVNTGNAGRPDGVPWNLSLIGADKVWESLNVTGQGIVVGTSDSGIDGDHPELAANYRGRDRGDDYNWFDPWNHSHEPTDTSGHGTHTLATAVGLSTGVAPGAEWIGCVNLYRNLGNPANYLDCLQFMLAPFPFGGDPFTDGDPIRSAQVLNNSWGCTDMEGCDPEVLEPAARALQAAGIFVVASAGNKGPRCASVQDPLAIYEAVLSVGAVDNRGALSSFSSRGPVTVDGSGRLKPDLLAPGERVLSAFPDGTYAYEDGTSMAGPHLVGVVALMWSANPALIGNVDLTREILEDSAQAYQGSPPECATQSGSPNDAIGYGIVDAYAAVQAALKLP